jgi:hypothetical protein
MSAEHHFRSGTIHGRDEDDLQRKLYDLKVTDGLPVILPTPERVEEMLFAAALAGFESDIVLGEIGPNMGQATVEKVAINAVMAGCLPDHIAMVIAAVQALCDPAMDTSEFQVTTHSTAPLLIISGPNAKERGIASGFGALGYGHRANLSIGRAVRLCLLNLGGVWPGESDMAILGQPGSVACCLGEDEDDSPFPPLRTALGFDADTDVVTALCVSPPISVLCPPASDDPDWGSRLLTLLAKSISSAGHNNAMGTRGTVVVILNPDHARELHNRGFDREKIIAELIARSVNPAGEIERLRFGRQSEDPARLIRAIGGPDRLLVLVAGGPGVYSAVMTPWGGAPHGNGHVSRKIVFQDSCEVHHVAD